MENGISYASVQVNIEGALADDIARYRATLKDVKELETDPHVTVFYGLDRNVTAESIQAAVKGVGAFWFALGPNGRFDGVEGGESDCLWIGEAKSKWTDFTSGTGSGSLRKLHDILARHPAADPRFAERTYVPHLTLAYVEPGSNQDWGQEDSPVKNRQVFVDRLILSRPSKISGGERDDFTVVYL